MKGRALTPEQKTAITERLFIAWSKVPELRLGQLIENVLAHRERNSNRPQGTRREEEQIRQLYYLEDEAFIQAVEAWVDLQLSLKSKQV